MSDAAATDLRCRECGARLQPTQEWCSLCHAPRVQPNPVDESVRSTDADSAATDKDSADSIHQLEGSSEEPRPGGHRRRAARSDSKRTRLVAAGLLVAVAVSGGAVALSTGGSSKSKDHGSPAGKPPAGTTFGVLPGAGTPTNIPLPGRISR